MGKRTIQRKPRVEEIFRGRNIRRSMSVSYASLLRQGANLKKRFGREFPRGLVLGFVCVFLLSCVSITYIVSGGKPIFGPSVAAVSEKDMFFQFYMDDESRANVMGPKGGPASAVAPLKLFTYTIGKDDSLSRIAQKTGVTIDALISLNKLNDAHMIRIGAQLTIPNQRGIYYSVKKRDTLSKIAKKYKTTIEKIQYVNGLADNSVAKGAVLFVPGAKLSASQMEKVLGLIFRRPARGGWLSSGYGYRRNPFTFRHQFHPGIDIALPYWTPIVAVRSGRVLFSGWRGGYGKLVVVRHRRGYSTRYGHMIKYIVRAGQWVRAGQRLGYVGSTGNSTGPHLHFELRRYGRLRNPFRERGFRRAYRRGY